MRASFGLLASLAFITACTAADIAGPPPAKQPIPQLPMTMAQQAQGCEWRPVILASADSTSMGTFTVNGQRFETVLVYLWCPTA